MRKKLLDTLLLPALLLCAQAAAAGAPLKINFQGRLTESGQPAQGTKSFVFKIYSAASGGAPVWTGAPQSVALSGGVFSAELSAGAPALSTATFAGARYVEMIVDGVPLSPRQEMMSAPYALVAQALAPDADVPPAAIAAGSLTDQHVALTTAAIGSGSFSDDRVRITTGAFAALNGADQLVKLDSAGKLPLLDGSALTGVAAASYSGNVAASQLTGLITDSRVAISTGAFPGGFNNANQLVKLDGSGNLPVLNGSALTNVAAASYSGSVAVSQLTGVINDSRVAISTGAFPGGFNNANQLVKLDGSGNLPVLNGSALTNVAAASYSGSVAVSQLTGVINDSRVAISTGAFPGGFNAANQLVRLDASGKLPALNSAGPMSLPITNIAADGVSGMLTYTALAPDSVIVADTSLDEVTVVLPSAAGVAGRIYTIKRADPVGTYSAWLTTTGAETIDGYNKGDSSLPLEISGQWDFYTVQSNGVNWLIINR